MKSLKAIAAVIGVIIAASVIALLSFGKNNHEVKTEPVAAPAKSLYEIEVKDIEGSLVKLEKYRGKALLIVNVASQCGYTPQYDGLQKVYAQYNDKGLVVLGFPANNFGGQEPGTEEEIREFCRLKYNVSFPMFAKLSAKGADIHPLYQYLTDKTTNPEFAGDITWNFNKFVVNRQGKILARFASGDKPESDKVIAAIEQALK